MSAVQIKSFLAEHCVKLDVAKLVAESTALWKAGLGKKKAPAGAQA